MPTAPKQRDLARNSLLFRCFGVIVIGCLVVLVFTASKTCKPEPPSDRSPSEIIEPGWSGRLEELSVAWNLLEPPQNPPPRRLRIALFVKRWPKAGRAGGLERHASTLHSLLARRGHVSHVFTADPGGAAEASENPNTIFHFSKPSARGVLDPDAGWAQFLRENASSPFDVVHSESVALAPRLAANSPSVAATWHGIAYEAIHSEVAQDLARLPGEPRSVARATRLETQLFRLIEEVKFFDCYAHHVATSDYEGEVLRRIYMIPSERVHVILTGIDERVFRADAEKSLAFRRRHGVPDDAKLVVGLSGRLVKDKGHPIMVEALKEMMEEDSGSLNGVFFLVAGEGPWAARYRSLGASFLVLGSLNSSDLAAFYNALDVFVDPTLRAQGLDLSVLEAMNSGKPALVTSFAGLTESAIVGPEMGYVAAPKVSGIKETLSAVIRDGRSVLEEKGSAAMRRALKLFTATKMVAAYERLFLCIASKNAGDGGEDYCRYP
ncbi:uncharacterized protein LOC144715797 [Wolffia australiana]